MKNIINKIIEENKKWSDPEYCLEAVKTSSFDLGRVVNQTPEICLAAIKSFWEALYFVREQTPEICIAALKQN